MLNKQKVTQWKIGSNGLRGKSHTKYVVRVCTCYSDELWPNCSAPLFSSKCAAMEKVLCSCCCYCRCCCCCCCMAKMSRTFIPRLNAWHLICGDCFYRCRIADDTHWNQCIMCFDPIRRKFKTFSYISTLVYWSNVHIASSHFERIETVWQRSTTIWG